MHNSIYLYMKSNNYFKNIYIVPIIDNRIKISTSRSNANDKTRIRENAHYWNAYLPESRSLEVMSHEAVARFAKYLDILSRVGFPLITTRSTCFTLYTSRSFSPTNESICTNRLVDVYITLFYVDRKRDINKMFKKKKKLRNITIYTFIFLYKSQR